MGLGFGVWGSYLFMQLPVLFVFCAIALRAATFFSSVVSRWASVFIPPCGRDLFMFPCFWDGVPMFCSGYIVHTFPPLCHFLCVGIRTNRANMAKLKGVQNWHFLQVSKTMGFNPRLLLLFMFFYFLVVLCLVVILPFVLSSMQEAQKFKVKA